MKITCLDLYAGKPLAAFNLTIHQLHGVVIWGSYTVFIVLLVILLFLLKIPVMLMIKRMIHHYLLYSNFCCIYSNVQWMYSVQKKKKRFLK